MLSDGCRMRLVTESQSRFFFLISLSYKYYSFPRPIKKLDYVGGGSSKKPSWKATKKTSDNVANQRPAESEEKLFHVRNLKPKSLTVVAMDDTSNRARLILNRRTAMTYEGVLQTVSDILQLNSGHVKDLFTMDGKKV